MKTGSMKKDVAKANITRRDLLGTAGLAAGAAALAGCSSSGSGSSAGSDAGSDTGSSSGDLQSVSFVLDYSPNVNHTGIYVAVDKGWFADEGLDVEIVPVPDDGADALIGSGGADLGLSYQDNMAASLGSDNPMPYTAVAAVVQHNTSGIMSREEDGITRPGLMEGTRYASWGNPVEQATVKQVVEDDGGDFSKVEIVTYDVDDEVTGLKADMFDTVWVYEWWAVQNAKLQDYAVNYFSFRDIDELFDYYTPVICANDDFASENPDIVKAFLRAAKKGYEFAAENPDEAAQILCDQVPELDADLIAAAQASISPYYISDAESWGVIDEDRWSAYYQWLNDNSLTENSFDPKSGWTADYLA
jgi:ABC-type nitrate/sulfonate/bicarbonate transport system substrate-binding protein